MCAGKWPKHLEAATARVTGASKTRQPWLKETLGTKDEKRARVLAKPVMMKFDRIIAQAEALAAEHPMRTELTEGEIKQISDYFYALQLRDDEELRAEGIGDDPLYDNIRKQLSEAGIELESSFSIEKVGSGLSDRMMHKIDEGTSIVLPALKEALARGNVEFIRYELNEILQLFRINLDQSRSGALISTRTHHAFSAEKARGVTLGNPRLRVARKGAVDAVKAETDRYAANVPADHTRGLEGGRPTLREQAGSLSGQSGHRTGTQDPRLSRE
jgi:hypothetical protein